MEQNQFVSLAQDGEPRASTDVIALGMAYQHASVIKLVRKHLASLEEFGGVRFEIRPFATAGGTQEREMASLNEQQTALLISLMRNKAEVVAFKVALVKEFYRMREAIDAGFWKRRLALETRDATSAAKASIGSRLMTDRKKALPSIKSERALLDQAMQPTLLN